MTALTKVENINDGLSIVNDVANIRDMAKKLMETKHYQKIGEDGIFAICMTAKANGIDQRNALNGEMYYVQGRVGMSAEAMNKYIRMAGHSISLVKLDDTGCTIRGKRKDTGDTAEISFGVDDMKSAGKNYDKNRKDMFWARALSRLKRILFPDILTKIYEKGEIDEMALADAEVLQSKSDSEVLQIRDVKQLYIGTDKAIELSAIFTQCSAYFQKNFMEYLKKRFDSELLDDIPESEYENIKQMLCTSRDNYQAKKAKSEMKVDEETGEVMDAD